MRKVDTDGAAGSTGNVSASLYPMSKMGARTNQFGVRSGIGGVTIHQETIIASDDVRAEASSRNDGTDEACIRTALQHMKTKRRRCLLWLAFRMSTLHDTTFVILKGNLALV